MLRCELPGSFSSQADYYQLWLEKRNENQKLQNHLLDSTKIITTLHLKLTDMLNCIKTFQLNQETINSNNQVQDDGCTTNNSLATDSNVCTTEQPEDFSHPDMIITRIKMEPVDEPVESIGIVDETIILSSTQNTQENNLKVQDDGCTTNNSLATDSNAFNTEQPEEFSHPDMIITQIKTEPFEMENIRIIDESVIFPSAQITQESNLKLGQMEGGPIPRIPNIINTGGMSPSSNQIGSQLENLIGIMPMAKDSQAIWQGNIDFQDKPVNRVVPSLPCSIFANVINGEVEVSSANWPLSLSVQLVPKKLIMAANLLNTSKTTSRHVIFQLDQENEGYQKLTKLMTNGFIGVIQFPQQSDTRIMLVLYTPEKRLFSGVIDNDQDGFCNRMRQMYDNHRKQQRAKQQKLNSSEVCFTNISNLGSSADQRTKQHLEFERSNISFKRFKTEPVHELEEANQQILLSEAIRVHSEKNIKELNLQSNSTVVEPHEQFVAPARPAKNTYCHPAIKPFSVILERICLEKYKKFGQPSRDCDESSALPHVQVQESSHATFLSKPSGENIVPEQNQPEVKPEFQSEFVEMVCDIEISPDDAHETPEAKPEFVEMVCDIEISPNDAHETPELHTETIIPTSLHSEMELKSNETPLNVKQRSPRKQVFVCKEDVIIPSNVQESPKQVQRRGNLTMNIYECFKTEPTESTEMNSNTQGTHFKDYSEMQSEMTQSLQRKMCSEDSISSKKEEVIEKDNNALQCKRVLRARNAAKKVHQEGLTSEEDDDEEEGVTTDEEEGVAEEEDEESSNLDSDFIPTDEEDFIPTEEESEEELSSLVNKHSEQRKKALKTNVRHTVHREHSYTKSAIKSHSSMKETSEKWKLPFNLNPKPGNMGTTLNSNFQENIKKDILTEHGIKNAAAGLPSEFKPSNLLVKNAAAGLPSEFKPSNLLVKNAAAGLPSEFKPSNLLVKNAAAGLPSEFKPSNLHVLERIPSTQTIKWPLWRCVVCYKKGIKRQSRFWCSKCEACLCILKCFEIYHA